MREEALKFSRTNSTQLRPERWFLLELDEERYVTGNKYYTDKCHFLSAARAAMCASRRKVLKGGRSVNSLGRRAMQHMKQKFDRGFNGLKSTSRKVRRQIVSEHEEGSPFVAVACGGKKRRVISGPARIAKLRSNKSYKPGD